MRGQAQVKVTVDRRAGNRFKLVPVGQHGETTSQYVPDLMRSPSELTYIFDDPEILHLLIVALSAKDTSGVAISTGTLTLMQKIRLELDGERHRAGVPYRHGGRYGVMEQWAQVISRLPKRHAVREVQLKSTVLDIGQDDMSNLAESIKQSLSVGAETPVTCVVVA